MIYRAGEIYKLKVGGSCYIFRLGSSTAIPMYMDGDYINNGRYCKGSDRMCIFSNMTLLEPSLEEKELFNKLCNRQLTYKLF